MEASDIANLLAENKAQISNLAEHQGLGEDVMVRFWVVNQEDLEGCVAHLKAQTTIENPMTGTRWARAGTWYAGNVDYKPGNTNPLVVSGAGGLVWILYQQLSKGDKIITITEDCAAYSKTKIIHTYNPSIPSGTAGAAGQIVTVDAQPTALGRERTIQETKTVKDQVAIAGDSSAAADSVRIMHTEGPAIGAATGGGNGTIIRHSAQPTESGKERTVKETITPKNQTAISYKETHFEESASVLHTEADEPLGAPTEQAGKIKENDNLPTEAGKTKTLETVRTAKEVIVAEHTAAITDDHQDKVERGHNVKTKPTISAVEGADVQLDYDINGFGRYDYVKKTRTSNIPLSCPGITSWKTEGLDYIVYAGKTWDSTEKRYSASGEYVYRVTVWHGIAFYKTADEAAAALPTIATAIGGLRVDEGSGVYPAGSNLWQARVRSRNDAYISFTNYGGPRWI